MGMRRYLPSIYWGAVFRFSKKRRVLNVRVGVFLPDDEIQTFERITSAIGVLQRFSPHHYARLLDGVRILVIGRVGPWGEWHVHARMIQLREDWVTRSETDPVHIAATIVHELTHAKLDEGGVTYVELRRRRLEAMCYRAQARFVARMPGCEEVSDYYRERAAFVMNQSDDQWSDDAFRTRDLELLTELNTPAWMLAFLRRRAKKRSAV